MRSALKFLESDEQRAQALAGTAKWKAFFANEPQWKKAVERISRFTKEDHLRLVETKNKSEKIQASNVLPSSNLGIASTARKPRPDHLRMDKVHMTIPRNGRSATVSTPPTPLVSSPLGNAFGPGGVWESLTPKPSPSTTCPQMPVTAIASEPWSPIIPERDSNAKAVYKDLKKVVDQLTLELSASRLGIPKAPDSEHNVIHRSMVRPRDALHAAQYVLAAHVFPLKQQIPTHMLESMLRSIQEEGEILQIHRFCSVKDVEDKDSWLGPEDDTFTARTPYDGMRDLFRSCRNQRKTECLSVSEAATKYAWAAKILDDAETRLRLKCDDDSDTCSDDDTDYAYINFMPDLKGIVESKAYTSFKSVVDVSSLGSSGTTTDLSDMARNRKASVSTKGDSPTTSLHPCSSIDSVLCPLSTSTTRSSERNIPYPQEERSYFPKLTPAAQPTQKPTAVSAKPLHDPSLAITTAATTVSSYLKCNSTFRHTAGPSAPPLFLLQRPPARPYPRTPPTSAERRAQQGAKVSFLYHNLSTNPASTHQHQSTSITRDQVEDEVQTQAEEKKNRLEEAQTQEIKPGDLQSQLQSITRSLRPVDSTEAQESTTESSGMEEQKMLRQMETERKKNRRRGGICLLGVDTRVELLGVESGWREKLREELEKIREVVEKEEKEEKGGKEAGKEIKEEGDMEDSE